MSLTLREASALREGELVRVKWSGGNGPHLYRIRRWEDGTVWAVSPRKLADGEDYLVDRIFVPGEHAKVLIHSVERVAG